MNTFSSWVPGADDSAFDAANLPIGIFAPPSEAARPGVAIGEWAIDLQALLTFGLIDEPALDGAATLNAFLATGRERWTQLRARLQHLIGTTVAHAERTQVEAALVRRADITMALPIDVQDYVDFYSSIEHATNAGSIFRPGAPLLKNYRHIPIGYHGRSANVVVSGTPVRRPSGQSMAPDASGPSFGPCRNLDFELELGFITGSGSADDAPIPVDRARDHVYGYVLLNDWSARDIQAWEMQPLGPFLSKSFATSISPWIVSLDALEPFRVDNRVLDPEPLPYLRTAERYAYDIELEVLLETARMREAGTAPATIVRTNFRDMYWHYAQQLAHLTSNGSSVRAGDLCGSGTVSGLAPGTMGSLLEATANGTQPLVLPNGEERGYLADGDTVIMRAQAAHGERRVGFGEVRGTVVP